MERRKYNTKASSNLTSSKGQAVKNGLMEQSIKVYSTRAKNTSLVGNTGPKINVSTQVNGIKKQLKDLVNMNGLLKKKFTLVFGGKINCTVSVNKHGPISVTMLAISNLIRSTDMEYIDMQTELNIKAPGLIIKCMALAFTQQPRVSVSTVFSFRVRKKRVWPVRNRINVRAIWELKSCSQAQLKNGTRFKPW